MKVITIEDLYPKIGIVNGTIGYVQNISIKRRDWIHYDELMHPPMNILVDFTEFIEKKWYITKHNSQRLTKKCGAYSPHY
jgi:hypothetical protein